MSVNVGTLEGLLRWKVDSAELERSLNETAKKADVSRKELNQYNRELKSITSSYERVAASLDPLTANTQKYERAQKSLSAALKSGIISQDQYNRSLSLAKEKYLGVNASTLTWREEMQRLTNVISPFSGKLTNITSFLDSITSSLAGVSKGSAVTSAAVGETTEGLVAAGAGAGVATSSFAALGAALVPLAPLLAALAVSLGSVYVAAKAIGFITDAVKEGVETQLIIERLNESLRATGSYAQMSSAQLVVLAESYELLTGKQKEQIIAAELILSRFETLNNKTFPQALNITLAYARSLGVTAEEAAKRLGPALEGNTRSLGALKDAGIVLTASQRKTLTLMVEQGDITQYQTKLFEILREKVGELSTEYDTNLSRQVGRAQVIIQDFGEAIANEVIPAIEDLFQSIVASLGGWDSLKRKVNEVGADIGRFVRTTIYGLRIAFHQLAGTIDSVVANLSMLRSYFASDPINFKRLRDQSAEATSSAVEHGLVIQRITEELANHTTALEGNNEVYTANGSAIDSIIGKNKELESNLKALNDVYNQQTLELEKVYALRMLAAGGAGSLSEEDRIRGEQKINDEYEYRVSLLRLQAQFGDEIGKQLADQQRQLKELERQARIEISLAMELEPIKLDTKFIDDIFKSSQDRLTEYMTSIVAIEEANQQAFQQNRDDYQQWLEDFASSWRDSFRTISDITNEEIEKVKFAVSEGVMSIAEGEQAIALLRQESILSYIDQWGTFFSYLGNAFGGIFQRISQLIQSVQSGVQTGQQIGSQISGIGAAAGGMAGGIITVMIEAYKYFRSETEKAKQESYRYGAVISKGYDGEWSTPQMGETRRASMQIKDTIEALAEAIGGTFERFAALEIQVRRDGQFFHAFVEGVMVGSFKDMQSAVEAAILKALKSPNTILSGVSDLITEGLKYALSDGVVKVGTLDELQDFVGKLKTISDLSLSPAIVGLQSTMREFNRLREALNKLDQSSQTVIDSQNDLTRAQIKAVNDTIDAMLGIDRAANKALDDLLAFQRGLPAVADSFTSGLMESIKAAQRRLNELNNPGRERTDPGGAGPGSGSGSGGGGGVYDGGGIRLLSDTTDEINAEKIRLQKAIDDWTAQLAQVPKKLDENQVDLGIFTALEPYIRQMKGSADAAEMIAKFERIRLDAVFGQLKLQIIALGRWEEWAKTWDAIYQNAIANIGGVNDNIPTGGRRGGGGSGSSDKDSVRDFIQDKKFELSLVGLTAYQKSLKELDQQYNDLLKQAGKDKKLKQELMDLKEKELKQLAREEADRVRSGFREFMGLTTPFDKIRKTAADLIKDIKASPLGDAEKANKVARVLDEINRQVERMSDEMTAGLFSQMLSDMERFGATDEQMFAARQAMAILEHEMKMYDYAQSIAMLELEGRISAENLAILKAQYEFLNGIDPSRFINPTIPPVANDNMPIDYTSGGGVYTYQDYEDLLGSIRDQLAEWNRIPLSETLSRAHGITDSFNAMMADIDRLRQINPFNPEIIQLTEQAQQSYQNLVRNFIDDTLGEFEDVTEGLEGELQAIGDRFTDINAAFLHLGASQEDLARLETARLTAVRRAIDQYLDPIREFRANMQMGPLSTLTGEQRFQEAQRRFRDAYARVQSGDLSGLGDITSLAQQYGELLQSYTGGEGLRMGLGEIDDTLASIEQLVPGFADQMAEIGTETNPMYVLDARHGRPDEATRETISALEENTLAMNTGNSLLLLELRDGNFQARKQIEKLNDIRSSLSERPYTPVRLIA